MVTINQITPITITSLTDATTLDGNEYVPIVQNNATVKTSINALPQGMTAGVLVYGNTGGSPFPNYRTLKAGDNITIVDAGAQGDLTISGSDATGTVTSVGILGSSGINVSGSPITTSGNISISLGDITPTSVTSSGAISGSNLSGTNTGDQTITLTGDVTGSGTGSFAATIGATKVTLTKMATGSANSLIGYDASGTAAVVSVSTGLSLSGGVLTATGSGTVTTTGSPSSGNLTKFSGATSVTNTDLSGDITTNGSTLTTVAKIAGTAVTGTTGSGSVVFATSPALVTPALGTPSSGNLANCTNLSLTAGVSGVLPIANGGTNGTTATFAINNLLPSQTGNSGKVLSTNGTNVSWAVDAGGITLQTNSTPNGSQTLLNLKNGSNITITDDGVGGVTVAATGSVATGFNAISSGTNTTATMVVGTGASIAVSGTGTIAATSATNATNTAITDDTTTNATMYLTWVTANTGNLPQNVSSTKLSFNPSTAALTTTTFVGALTGNSSTATALQNARTIGGVSFNGTANITVATATGGFTVSGGDLAIGANNLTITGSIGSTGSRSTKGWFTDLQVTNAIAGSVTGNAATATALQNARTIGGVSFDGTTNITVSTATGGFTVSGGDLAIGANNLTVTGSIASTGSRVTKGWFTDLEVTNAPTSGGVAIPTISSTNTLTNKRVTKRTGTTTSSATPTINTDNVDFYSITAQTVDITSFTTNLSGTPTEAQTLWIAITGTAARAITWGASFEASTVALPTTTVSTNRLDVGFVWNTVSQKWRCVSTC